MEITFNTKNAEASVAVKAMQLYKNKQFKEAIPVLHDILDCEPNNWYGRLILGACYYKTQQYLAAQRLFRFLNETCPEREVRLKALEALRSTNTMLDGGTHDIPAEFGCYAGSDAKRINTTWLEAV